MNNNYKKKKRNQNATRLNSSNWNEDIFRKHVTFGVLIQQLGLLLFFFSFFCETQKTASCKHRFSLLWFVLFFFFLKVKSNARSTFFFYFSCLCRWIRNRFVFEIRLPAFWQKTLNKVISSFAFVCNSTKNKTKKRNKRGFDISADAFWMFKSVCVDQTTITEYLNQQQKKNDKEKIQSIQIQSSSCHTKCAKEWNH